MAFCSRIPFLLFLWVLGISGSAEPQSVKIPPSHSLYTDLVTPVLDPSRTAAVRDLTLIRDVGSWHFRWGQFHFFAPVSVRGEPRVTGALFVGEGTFEMTPPTDVEKHQLAILQDEEALSVRFDAVYFRFSDGIPVELQALVVHDADPLPKLAWRMEYAQDYLRSDAGRQAHFSLAMSALASGGYWYAHVFPKEDFRKPLFFEIDPQREEEVTLHRRPPGDTRRSREVANSFHWGRDYAKGEDLAHESKVPVAPLHYDIHARVHGGGRVAAQAKLTVRAGDRPVHGIATTLNSAAEVTSVTCTDDASVTFARAPDSWELFVFFSEPLLPETETQLLISYSGKVLQKWLSSLYVRDAIYWYPRIPWTKSTYDLRLEWPEKYELLAVGARSNDEVHKKTRSATWIIDVPTPFAAFNLGEFQVETIESDTDTIPDVAVYASKDRIKRHLKLGKARRNWFESRGRKVKNRQQEVGVEVLEACRFFGWLFGERMPFEKILVTEVPYSHGISFPGLLHLWSDTFEFQYEGGFSEFFRAHEVAHQWWGNSVDIASYHDVWLSEGFAEYAGYWYLGWARKDDKWTMDLLEEARGEILENRKKARTGDAVDSALWMGYRASNSEAGNDYQLLVYRKGALVLHMLRMLLRDLETFDDSAFVEMIRDFYATHRGRRASTDDFRRTVERHVGMDMRWFFDQWVMSADVPTYEVGSGWQQRPDGNWLLTVSATPKHVPEDFQNYVVVRVAFDQGDYYFRMFVDGEAIPANLVVPAEPQEVEFNALCSTLAEVVAR